MQEGIAVHIITRGAIKLHPPSIGSEGVAILLFPLALKSVLFFEN